MTRSADGEKASVRYLDAVEHLLGRLRGQLDAIETAAGWISRTIAADGLVFVAGTGHSHMIAEEVFYRAGGLTSVYPILEPSLLLDRGALKSSQLERLHGYGRIVIDDSGLSEVDVLLVVSNSGRNAVPVDMALRAREIGSKVIAITSLEHSGSVDSRHQSGKRLFEVADLVIDNCVPYGDASVVLDELPAAVGPLSTVAGAAIINALMARAIQRSATNGYKPDVFSSANLANGSDVDAEVLARSRSRVRAL